VRGGSEEHLFRSGFPAGSGGRKDKAAGLASGLVVSVCDRFGELESCLDDSIRAPMVLGTGVAEEEESPCFTETMPVCWDVLIRSRPGSIAITRSPHSLTLTALARRPKQKVSRNYFADGEERRHTS
jgi:hypothetical protein